MKHRRGRRILRKILEFFQLSTPCAPAIAPPLYTRAAPTVNIDQPPQYYPDRETEKISSTRHDLETLILHVWKEVYLGLYEIDDSDQYQARCRYDRLEALYRGAGLKLSVSLGEIHVLRRRFLRYVDNNGMLALKLFDNLSITTLQRVLETLEAYKAEIVNLERLEALLRNSQLALNALESGNSLTRDILRKEYLNIATPMGKRIEWYDIRMDMLNHDIHDEVMLLDHGRHQLKGEFVYHKVFPGRYS